jgi:hypothetical protein
VCAYAFVANFAPIDCECLQVLAIFGKGQDARIGACPLLPQCQLLQTRQTSDKYLQVTVAEMGRHSQSQRPQGPADARPQQLPRGQLKKKQKKNRTRNTRMTIDTPGVRERKSK